MNDEFAQRGMAKHREIFGGGGPQPVAKLRGMYGHN